VDEGVRTLHAFKGGPRGEECETVAICPQGRQGQTKRKGNGKEKGKFDAINPSQRENH